MKEANNRKLLIETDFLATRSCFLPANQNARLMAYNQSKFEWCHSGGSILLSKRNESARTILIII